MSNPRWIVAAVVLALVTAGAHADPDKDESGKGGERYEYEGDKHGEYKREERKGGRHEAGGYGGERGHYFERHGYSHLNIPAGHYPPPGECRVWYPDQPSGHQPPPVKCRDASVPPGAWLIRHPVDRPQYVHVEVYETVVADPRRPPGVMVIGEFDIGSGSFVRVVATP